MKGFADVSRVDNPEPTMNIDPTKPATTISLMQNPSRNGSTNLRSFSSHRTAKTSMRLEHISCCNSY